MLRRRKALALTVLAVLDMMLPALAGYRDDVRAISISGGEDHTLVLTNDKKVWTCGPNGGYAFGEYFFGILGTGSEDWSLQQKTLVSVHDGAMDTESDRLENINEIAAGWMHSLALDVNDSVWSWGWNAKGQLGIGTLEYKNAPVEVLRGDQADDPCEPSAYRSIFSLSLLGVAGSFLWLLM